MEPKIIFEDEDILAINKPAGMVVNNSDTTKDIVTLQDFVSEKLDLVETGDLENDFYSRGGIVHRLDKETSGVILIAKNPESFLNLQKQFKDRTVKKTYLALSHGVIKPEEGEISVPVGRLPWNRKQFGVVAGGREAVTKYKVLKNIEFKNMGNDEILSVVELYPETGRTHQIRVHLKHIGHPIFGDFLYAGRKTARNDRKVLSRVFLHAYKISFNHPRIEKRIEFEADVPLELKRIIG